MEYFSCLYLGLTILIFHTTLADITSFVVPCEKDDVACQTRVGAAAVPLLANGDPSLNMVVLDPLFAEELDLSTGGLKFTCYNATFKGLSGAVFKNFHINLAESKIDISVDIARLDILARYKSGGQILVLPIRGEGDAEVNIKKFLIDITYVINIKESNGKKYISLKDVSYKYEFVDNMHFRFENLFNGNKQLSDATHMFMNDQWKEMAGELSPPIVKLIVKRLTGNFKKLFNAVSLDRWIKI